MHTPTRAAMPMLELANDILACQDFDDLASGLLPRLTSFFRAGSSCAFEMRRDGRGLYLGKAAQLRMPRGSITDYSAHFVGLDPVCAPAFHAAGRLGLPPNRHGVVRLSDRCPRKTLLGSEYYNEFLREIHIRHVFGLMVRPEFDPSRIVVLGFHRPAGEEDFSFELDQAAALGPAFHASVERMCYRSQLELATTREAAPAVRRLVVHFAPDASLLRPATPSSAAGREGGDETICFPALLDALKKAGETTVVDARWKTLLTDIGVQGVELGWELSLSRVPSGALQRFDLELAAPAASSSLNSWAERIRLTPREADVAHRVSRGLRNAEVGRQLRLSPKTVENHLRSIYSKAGVQSRTQLLLQLLNHDPKAIDTDIPCGSARRRRR